MPVSRRTFLFVTGTATTALAAARLLHAETSPPTTAHLPLVVNPPPTPIPTPEVPDLPIIGTASGTEEQAIAWLLARSNKYEEAGIREIVGGYRSLGERVGVDWFLAIAQMCHETGSLTSFWCARPRRNPAGIGVDGTTSATPPQDPIGWAYNDTANPPRWERGLSFASWVGESIPAHLGRLLAYALPAGAGTPEQQEMISVALNVRPLPAAFRGVAPTIFGLNQRWAVPGTEYGQRIVQLLQRIRLFIAQ